MSTEDSFFSDGDLSFLKREQQKRFTKKSSSDKKPESTETRLPQRYKFIELLGEGAFGQVIKAIDKETDNVVAIKLQKLDNGDKIFEKEIKNLERISNICENLVCIIDSGLFYKKYYIVMNYISGKTLSEYAKTLLQSPKNTKNTILLIENVFKQLVKVTKKLHKAGFAHMDIKPANIIIDSNNILYLVDLGLSCFIDSECRGGSMKYLSPDLASNDFSIKGRQEADVWAIGYTLAKILEEEDYAEEVSKDIKQNMEPDVKPPKMKTNYLENILKLLSPKKERMKIFKNLN